MFWFRILNFTSFVEFREKVAIFFFVLAICRYFFGGVTFITG